MFNPIIHRTDCVSISFAYHLETRWQIPTKWCIRWKIEFELSSSRTNYYYLSVINSTQRLCARKRILAEVMQRGSRSFRIVRSVFKLENVNSSWWSGKLRHHRASLFTGSTIVFTHLCQKSSFKWNLTCR